MNDFLLNLGFSKELINDIIKVNGENTYADLCLNSDEVEKIINYFKEIGITCLNELLIYKIDIFFNDLSFIKNNLDNKDINELVKIINEDFYNIDLLIKES